MDGSINQKAVTIDTILKLGVVSDGTSTTLSNLSIEAIVGAFVFVGVPLRLGLIALGAVEDVLLGGTISRGEMAGNLLANRRQSAGIREVHEALKVGGLGFRSKLLSIDHVGTLDRGKSLDVFLSEVVDGETPSARARVGEGGHDGS